MGDSVYKVIEIIGTSSNSWEDAAKQAIVRASRSLEELRIAEVVEQDLKIEEGVIVAFRTKLRISFRFND